ncbi:protein TESPA1 [Gymnodraco acuticeps]|uniref:Protein TESPA1 n=1 Tax=Gymnodraco acuticeps TaxID=8218 RepID=A0A6P8SV28_GYMAC|nr:protein TESPA1 [Gymnodraco acuticeps]XP_034054322.1 protein TESPA1 [Gymnodraco acuticeps]XP_034054323.1 protein TESPA1 [Gymnodraco acuticeps]XP_034054324.1 protein TESPA1 [Gymnodraco acuticeps]
MESPPSTVRRRAWINSRRQRSTLEPDPEGPLCTLPSASVADDDDVFSDGCFTGKIENWLQSCGAEACSETTDQLSFDSELKARKCDDELNLGADASLLNGGEISSKACLAQHPSSKPGPGRLTSTPRKEQCLPKLNLGHSMASSCLSSSTFKTTSSISEVLQLCAEDAEETLYELGFGRDEPQVTVRIPPRFLNFPSLSRGINFRVFLDSQIRRIREEDPSLSLASRFRQVQVLTAMANAFYSLYSHVSRTPLQKLATPEFTFSSSPVEKIERFRGSIRSEVRSPVERLKDTVSKMCLYTGSPRGSDSTSPQPSPRKRANLPDVVGIVLEKHKSGATKKLDLGDYDRSNLDVRLFMDGDTSCDSGKEAQTQQSMEDEDILQNGNTTCHKMQGCKQTDNVDADENSVRAADLDSRTHSVTSLASSVSGETVIETELDSCASQRETGTADLKPVAKMTYDLICLQIVESVHQAPFCCQQTIIPKTNTCISSEKVSIDGSHEPDIQISIPEPDTQQTRAPGSLPVLAPYGDPTQCCITVTGWEGGGISPHSSNAIDAGHASTVMPLQKCEESFIKGRSRYLNPLTRHILGHDSNPLQQVNSFELEEVHSAGEEDFVKSETTTTTPLSSKGEMVRGDSMQSDSSGYADEEVSPSSNR